MGGVAAWGSLGVWWLRFGELQCGGFAVWGCCGMGSCFVWESQGGRVAVWGSRGVGELQYVLTLIPTARTFSYHKTATTVKELASYNFVTFPKMVQGS